MSETAGNSSGQGAGVQDRLESLLTELCILDPELGKQEHLLRLLLRDMLAGKPTVVPDQGFVKHLRDHLIHKSGPHTAVIPPKPKRKPHGVWFWTVSFAPLGIVAAAIIMLIVMPRGGPSITPLPSMRSDRDAGIESAEAPSEAMMTKQQGVGGDLYSISNDASNVAEAGMIGFLPTQGSVAEVYVTVDTPSASYVALYVDQNGKPGRFLGASRLLGAGHADNVQILLSRPPVPGETLYAELRYSNGDLRFDPSSDPPLYDAAGQVIHARMTIGQ